MKVKPDALSSPYVTVAKVMKQETNGLSFRVAVPRGKQRFRELIIYVSKKCEGDSFFGAIKLNKILYYSDFSAFEVFGAPLTGLPYFKLPFGPAPQWLLPIRTELINEGALAISQVEIGDLVQDRTIALRDPYLSLFVQDEIDLVDRVIEKLWGQTATEVSDASHDIRWRTLNLRDFLPYEFAYLDNELTSDDEARSIELAQQFGW